MYILVYAFGSDSQHNCSPLNLHSPWHNAPHMLGPPAAASLRLLGGCPQGAQPRRAAHSVLKPITVRVVGTLVAPSSLELGAGINCAVTNPAA